MEQGKASSFISSVTNHQDGGTGSFVTSMQQIPPASTPLKIGMRASHQAAIGTKMVKTVLPVRMTVEIATVGIQNIFERT
jgi:hypothetical protein